MEGAAGAERIAAIMERLRDGGKEIFADIADTDRLLDYSRDAHGLAEAMC